MLYAKVQKDGNENRQNRNSSPDQNRTVRQRVRLKIHDIRCIGIDKPFYMSIGGEAKKQYYNNCSANNQHIISKYLIRFHF